MAFPLRVGIAGWKNKLSRLILCTPLYLQRYKGEAFGTGFGRGVNFEGVVISQSLYDSYYHNTKFIPVIPQKGSYDNVPLPLKSYSLYRLMEQYKNLYRLLTAQPATSAPDIGQQKKLATNKGDNKVEDFPNGNTSRHPLQKHWVKKIRLFRNFRGKLL